MSLSKRLTLDELPEWVTESYVYQLFMATNSVVSVKLTRGRGVSTGKSALIEFNSREAAEGCLMAYNGKMAPSTDLRLDLKWAPEHTQPQEEFSAFVGDLAQEVTDSELLQVFQGRYASVFAAKIVKGFGFVRFMDEGERDRAITEMQGFLLHGRGLRLSLATAKRGGGGRPWGGEGSGGNQEVTQGDFDPTNTTLFIGGLAAAVTEADVTALFARFGQIVYVRIPPNKGCGFVQFVDRQSAVLAMQTLHGHSLQGMSIRVSWGKNSTRSSAPAAPMHAYTDAAAAPYHTAAPSYDGSWHGYTQSTQAYDYGYAAAWGAGYDGAAQGYSGAAYGGGQDAGWGQYPSATEAATSVERGVQSTFGLQDPRAVSLDTLNRSYMATRGFHLQPNVGRAVFRPAQAHDRLGAARATPIVAT